MTGIDGKDCLILRKIFKSNSLQALCVFITTKSTSPSRHSFSTTEKSRNEAISCLLPNSFFQLIPQLHLESMINIDLLFMVTLLHGDNYCLPRFKFIRVAYPILV